MEKLKNTNMQTEPAAIIAAIIGVIEAIVALLPLFGVPLTVEQLAGIMTAVVAAGSLIGAIWTRSIVYAPDTFENAISSKQAHHDAMTQ